MAEKKEHKEKKAEPKRAKAEVKVVKTKRAKPAAKPKAPLGAGPVVNIYDLEGKVKGTTPLPDAFLSEVRPDIIRRAVDVFRANRRQPYGPSPTAGMRHSVETWGKGRGVARCQRITGQFRGAQSPCAVGGRRAHPPKYQDYSKKMNKREVRFARISALAATADPAMVRGRGHRVPGATLPVILDDKFEELGGTREVIEVLRKLELYADVERARAGTHIRAGRGKMRSRRYRVPRSILVVLGGFKGAEKGLRNLPGVEVVLHTNLNTEHLAPGGMPGRLTVFTEGALEALGRWHA